ncbi:hypothetical protein [Streptococcus pantholopis]|uniref:Uncharacterized protein n=1 Tax=Streptococcus pantholopis TaxID=1811193 RepID=A0A172Q7X8_9STRE|nr:hypothetical protein [Streptococcus pantholopis]AND79527.1 hypothetical protein A0O21_05525 [Streptococcus pantholopis]
MEFLFIALLLLGYTIYYQTQMKKIFIKSKRSIFKSSLLLLAGVFFVLIRAPKAPNLGTNLLIGFLLILQAWRKEGLSRDRVITFGVRNGKLAEYEKLIIHNEHSGARLECQSSTRRSDINLYFKDEPKVIRKFLNDCKLHCELLQK